MADRPMQYGGSFAPPLPAEKLVAYKALAETADPQTKEAMSVLAKMLEEFRKTPESKAKGTPHPSGLGQIVLLEGEEIKRMWEHVPWQEELDMYAALFDKIDPVGQKELRDAAHHLLWFGRELCLDREPITNDKL